MRFLSFMDGAARLLRRLVRRSPAGSAAPEYPVARWCDQVERGVLARCAGWDQSADPG